MAIGRPLEYDPETALESAMNVFWGQGYEASSLQDLIDAMGLSRSSFYQAFDSKHALFQRCISHYRQTLVEQLRSELNSAPSARDFIETLITGIARETSGADSRRGCLLMNTASEFSQSDDAIAKLVSSSINDLVAVFELAVKQAQQQGDIPEHKDPNALANYLLTSISGLRNRVKGGASSKTVRQTASIVLSALD